MPKEQLAQCKVAVVGQAELRAKLCDLGDLGGGVGDVRQELIGGEVSVPVLVKACQLKTLWYGVQR